MQSLRSNQKSWKVKFHKVKISLTSVMDSKEFLPLTNKTRRWSFLFPDMEVTDVETDLKISLERVSEKILCRVKNFKET